MWSAPADTLRAFTNVLYRLAGNLTWLIGDQTSPAAVSSRIDDLRPLKGYDFAVQAYSQFGIGGPLTIISNQIAPAESTAPSVPSGLTAIAQGLRTVQLDWIDNVEPDLSEYAVYQQSFTTLLDNGGFEEGLDGWALFGTPIAGESALAIRTSNPVNGSQALRVIGTGGTGIGQQRAGITVTSGGTYTIGGWMLLAGWTAGGQAHLDVFGTSLNTSDIIITATTTGWQFVRETFTVPVGTTSLTVRAYITNTATGTAYYDSLFLHVGSPAPSVKISEVRASRFTASNIQANAINYFNVAAIDQLENMSAKCAPVGIVAEPVTSGDVNPSPPLALTTFAVSLQGTAQTYQSSDGGTLAYATMTWANPTDTRRQFINVMYRLNGATTWQIADQTGPTAASSRIDDLKPLKAYDFAVQPYSQFGIAGPIVSVLNQVAPADGTAPATPSGLIAVAFGLHTIQLDWTDNLEPDLAEYAVYHQFFTNLLNNGDFEEGLDSWIQFGTPAGGETATAIRLTNPVNGSQCYRIIAAGGAGVGHRQNAIPVTAGATYTLGGWISISGWSGGTVTFDVTGTGLDTSGISFNANTVGWQFVRETFVVPVGTTAIDVRIFMNNGTGAVYVDSLYLHAGSPNPLTKISEVRASRFIASNVATGTIYYYRVAAIDRLENESAKSAMVAVYSSPVTSGDVNPAAPLTLTTLTSPSEGTYQSNDGTTWSYMTLSWTNPTDTRRAVINVLFRKVGAVTWHTADQTTGTTGRVDDLSPGQMYDFGVQPLSQFGVAGAVTTLLNQVAPGDTTAPSQVLGLSLAAAPPRGIRARWSTNGEADMYRYNIQSDTVNTFNSGNLLTRRSFTNELTLTSLVNGTLYYVRVQAEDFTGNVGTYSSTVSFTVPRNATDDYSDDSLTTPKRQAVNSQSSTTLSAGAATHTHVENVNATYIANATTNVNTVAIMPVVNVSFSHGVGKTPVVSTYSSNTAIITACTLVNTTNINVSGYNHLATTLGPIIVAQYW